MVNYVTKKRPNGFWNDIAKRNEEVYRILTEAQPELASQNRIEVMNAILTMPADKGMYFKILGLSSLFSKRYASEDNTTPSSFSIIKFFDQAYQQKTGDKSLFDLSEKEHLHSWDKKVGSLDDHLKNYKNLREAVYHSLTEANPAFGSTNPAEIINAFKNMPCGLIGYFRTLGMDRIADTTLVNRNSLVAYGIFDHEYQVRTRNPSLFDKTQKYHLNVDENSELCVEKEIQFKIAAGDLEKTLTKLQKERSKLVAFAHWDDRPIILRQDYKP